MLSELLREQCVFVIYQAGKNKRKVISCYITLADRAVSSFCKMQSAPKMSNYSCPVMEFAVEAGSDLAFII